jgi:hypothetical protein
MRNFIGRVIFWFIKGKLEEWNANKARERVRFYEGLFKKKESNISVKYYVKAINSISAESIKRAYIRYGGMHPKEIAINPTRGAELFSLVQLPCCDSPAGYKAMAKQFIHEETNR